MRFSKYFQAWSTSYYANAVNIGKLGDFYTAVSVGELFGFLCAKRFISLIESGRIRLPIDIVEIGANEGYLLNDFLKYLHNYKKDFLPHIKAFIIEPHEKLKLLQKQNCKYDFTHCDFANFTSDNVFFLANELFDTFACELYDDGKIAFVKNHKIYFDDFKGEFIYQNSPKFKKGEFSPYLYEFLHALKHKFKDFYFLTFDYFNEYLIDEFSIKIFKNHEIINPFKADLASLYANSDITYNVNFDEFAFYAKLLEIEFFIQKQSRALMDFGICDFANEANQIKNLLFGFSDNFKCLEFYSSSFSPFALEAKTNGTPLKS